MYAILIAEEDLRICRVIREFFQNTQRMIVQCAHTGPEATRMLGKEHFDLALIGLPLTGSSGFDLAALAAEKDVPVLLMTGHPGLRLTMRHFGFHYLSKPFTLTALIASTEQVISDHAGQSANGGLQLIFRLPDRCLPITPSMMTIGSCESP